MPVWLLPEVNDMLCSYTAKYTRLAGGYMGQLVEWPEVVTEGADLDESMFASGVGWDAGCESLRFRRVTLR